MTRRVVLAIAGVAALAVIGFGIPLGAVIQQVYVKDELVRLEREDHRSHDRGPEDLRPRAGRIATSQERLVARAVPAERPADRGTRPGSR